MAILSLDVVDMSIHFFYVFEKGVTSGVKKNTKKAISGLVNDSLLLVQRHNENVDFMEYCLFGEEMLSATQTKFLKLK